MEGNATDERFTAIERRLEEGAQRMSAIEQSQVGFAATQESLRILVNRNTLSLAENTRLTTECKEDIAGVKKDTGGIVQLLKDAQGAMRFGEFLVRIGKVGAAVTFVGGLLYGAVKALDKWLG